MSTRVRLWLITGLTLVLFTVATLVVRAVVEPAGGASWIVLGGLAALGLTATGLVHRFLSVRWKDRIRREKIAAREDQIAQAFTAAKKRLSASGRAESPRVEKLPLVLLLGPQGSTKTTAVVRSGLEPELLAGEVHQGDAIVPTETVNLWFAEGTVFLEVGGRLLEQEERWEAVLDHAQPARLAAAFGRGVQAPRAALVCVGADEFLKPGAAESVPVLARKLRDRLTAAAQALGIQLPVYVLFTRADRLPYFEDYVRSLSREESLGALGATLSMEDPSRSGAFAQVQAERVDRAMDGLLRHLALNRREVLGRESDPEVQAGAYEFPREVGKVRALIQRFLVDLCRPSQLSVSPFLRGFYVTGVRAITVSDPGAPSAPSPATPGEDAPMGATAVFDASKLQAQAASRAAPSSRSRRVPDWVFLEPVFRDVVLADSSARAVTSGGSRVHFLRRALLTAATLAALFLVGAFTRSFFQNRGLANRMVEGASAASQLAPTSTALPVYSDLQALERLREPMDRLWTWRQAGAPWSYRWGLWTGDDLYDDGKLAYLGAFERLVGEPARAALVDTLNALPEQATAASDYETTYNGLKAYLIMTEEWQHSTPDFLPGAVMERWPDADYPQEPQGADLLEAQLDLYARLIAEGHPSPTAPRGEVVARTRTFLSQFNDRDRFYQSVLAEAGSQSAAVNFATRSPTGASVVVNDYVVPAAFTRPARNWVLYTPVDSLFPSEDWVVGSTAVVPPERRVALADSLRERYQVEYLDHWTRFLQAARVVGFSSAGDAANKLGRLNAIQSPLLDLLAVTSQETDVEPSPVLEAFQSVHSVLPPGAADTARIGDYNEGYVQALRDLERAMDGVARADQRSRPVEVSAAIQAASRAGEAVRSLQDGFSADSVGAPVRTALTEFLLQPVRRAQTLIENEDVRMLNRQGQDFCARYEGLLRGFPFQRGVGRQAGVQDVVQALKPGESLLSDFLEGVLGSYLTRQGSRYGVRSGADPTPTGDFVAFVNRAAGVSDAIFDDRGNLAIEFTLQPAIPPGYEAIRVSIDGETRTFTRTDRRAMNVLWRGDRGNYARVTGVTEDGSDVSLADHSDSPWAVFELFQRAQWSGGEAGRYTVRWDIPEHNVTLSAAVGITTPHRALDPSFLQGALPCVGTIAR